jgi:hypothetical protein
MKIINFYKSSSVSIVSNIPSVIFKIIFILMVVYVPLPARADNNVDCEPIAVYEYSNRIGVECLTSYPEGNDILALDWVKFVSFPKTDVAQMERFRDTAMRALIENLYFRVFLPSSSAGNVNGCLSDNCRTVSTPFSIRQK